MTMISRERENYASFEEQFAIRDEFGILDISPEEIKGRSILFAPGWNAKVDSYKETIRVIFENGRKVVSSELLGEGEDQKAEQLISFANAKKFDDFDIIAHSLGSLSTAKSIISGRLKPHGVVFINPAGMAGYESRELVKHYMNLVKNSEEETGNQKIGIRGIIKISEVVSKFDMYEALFKIKRMGINVATIHTTGDKLSLWTDVEIESQRRGWEGIFMNGTHMEVENCIPEALQLLEG